MVGDSTPRNAVSERQNLQHTAGLRQPISKRLSSPIRMTSLRLGCASVCGGNNRESVVSTHLFTMIAPSSMMHPEPMTIGPAMAKMVAFGWTIVPASRTMSSSQDYVMGRYSPAPIVISPFSSTSWQTTALECIVNLSRLESSLVSQCQQIAGMS